jgi:Leucine Rich repeat
MQHLLKYFRGALYGDSDNVEVLCTELVEEDMFGGGKFIGGSTRNGRVDEAFGALFKLLQFERWRSSSSVTRLNDNCTSLPSASRSSRSSSSRSSCDCCHCNCNCTCKVPFTELWLSNDANVCRYMKPLCVRLQSNSWLCFLDLRRCSIDDDGAMLLAEALDDRHRATRSGVVKLLLERNNIGTLGAIALAQMLHWNASLRHLDLSENARMTSIAGVALANVLRVNRTLEELLLLGSLGTDREYMPRFEDAVRVNPAICCVALNLHSVVIDHALCRNRSNRRQRTFTLQQRCWLVALAELDAHHVRTSVPPIVRQLLDDWQTSFRNDLDYDDRRFSFPFLRVSLR